MINAVGRRAGARPFWKISVLAALAIIVGVAPAGAADPIRIGFGMALAPGFRLSCQRWLTRGS